MVGKRRTCRQGRFGTTSCSVSCSVHLADMANIESLGLLGFGVLSTSVKGTQWPGYVGPPLPSPRLKVALAGQQLVELLNILASKQGWSRHAVARAVCNYVTEVLPPQPHPCALAVGGFEGLDLNNLEYSDLTSKQLGELRLRVLATVLQ